MKIFGVVQIESIHTPRKCTVCQQPAKYWAFSEAAVGGVDKSSKQPRCEEHA